MPRRSIAHETQHAFDLFANAYTVIQEQHRMVHDGYMFHAAGQVLDLANGGTLEFLFVTPENCYPHLQKIVFFLEDAPCQMQVYEGATVSANGTEATVLNTNRNSPNTPCAQLFVGPTVTADGSLFHDRYFPTAGKDTGLVEQGMADEWIFKPSTNYLFRLTNNSGGIIDFGFEGKWYEIGDDSQNGSA